jgi:hypothetical protein
MKLSQCTKKDAFTNKTNQCNTHPSIHPSIPIKTLAPNPPLYASSGTSSTSPNQSGLHPFFLAT